MNCIPSNPIARVTLFTAANTGVAAAISAPACACGSVFGAISAPLALSIYKLGQMFVHKLIHTNYHPRIIYASESSFHSVYASNDHAELKAKNIANILLSLIATVSAVALTVLIVNGIGFNLSFGMGYALGAPMIASALIYTLYAYFKSNQALNADFEDSPIPQSGGGGGGGSGGGGGGVVHLEEKTHAMAGNASASASSARQLRESEAAKPWYQFW